MSSSLATQQPLYAQIKAAITKRINEDKWPVDFQIPREEDLAEEFDASPLTVRRALRELQSEGLLVRIQGRGTFVLGSRMQCAVFDLKDVSEEIEDAGGVHTSEVIVLEVLDPQSPFGKLLQLPPDVPVFHSRIVHKEDGTPIQIEDRFVNSSEAPDYMRQDFARLTPHDYLLRETEVTSVDNTIRAIRPDRESAQLLQIDENQPCLLLDRRTWRNAVPVTRSRFLYPGDRYRLRSSHEASYQGSKTAGGKAASPAVNIQPPRKIR
ncbi:histidine utilization repressor [Labrys monachus]|uniref:Histidine utilization repressor n=1 Tax=Labrys monachus TaxID=217067 RepID=A0ABU0FG96_9HYPH|nr:histidine utilization repressor [Labrys monachus]MDQ0393634.1 GntR family histidine utilization transcriptional repressor [Labrys monachus]